MSELRVDSVKSKGGGAPDLPKGVTISGIATAATLGATTVDVSNVNVSGVVTSGTLNGPLLSTGTPTLGLGVTINSSGLVVTGVATAGIVSATTLYGDGTNLTGIGASIAPLFYNPDISDRTVSVGTGIGITFNQQIKAGSGNINLRLVSIGGTIVEAFGVGSSVTISENRVSFDPASDLDQDTIYCVDIPGTALTNNEGTAYVGTAYTFQSKFTLKQLYTWGDNNEGTLASNSPEPSRRSSPTQVPGTTWSAFANIPGRSTMSSGAIKTDGTLWVWGRGGSGQLMQNNRTVYSSPIQVPGTNWGTTYDTFSMGYNHSASVKTDGTLWVCGYNLYGNLGQNDRTQRSSPVQVGSGTDWSKVNAGHFRTLAIKTDGSLWSWGYNLFGELGVNTGPSSQVQYSSPAQVPGTTWKMVSDTGNNTYFIKTDGTLWACGYNGQGNLGTNTNGDPHRSSPTQIPGTTWNTVRAVYSGAVATKTDGTAWIWGINEYGQLGLNDKVRRSSPIQIPGTTWVGESFTATDYQSVAALKTDGTAWVWGRDNKGTLGLNQAHQTYISSPTQIPGTDWSKLSMSMTARFGIKSVEG